MTPAERIGVGAALPWLPASAFTSGIAEPALAQVVEHWSSHWFRKARLRLPGALQLWTGWGSDWNVTGGGLALTCPAEARIGLAGLVLGMKLDRVKLNAVDLRLTDQLARYCLADLSSRLADLMGLEGTPGAAAGSPEDFGEAWSGSIRSEGGLTIGIVVAADLLAQLIKSRTPSERTDAPLSPLQSGLDDQIVTVAALLGRCRVSLADLATLEPGDVLCLDSGIDQCAGLTINHAVSSVTCRIEQDGAALQLRLIE